jgi:hypothetical protein
LKNFDRVKVIAKNVPSRCSKTPLEAVSLFPRSIVVVLVRHRVLRGLGRLALDSPSRTEARFACNT